MGWRNDSLRRRHISTTTTTPTSNKAKNLNGAGSKDEAKNPKETDMEWRGDIARMETISMNCWSMVVEVDTQNQQLTWDPNMEIKLANLKKEGGK